MVIKQAYRSKKYNSKLWFISIPIIVIIYSSIYIASSLYSNSEAQELQRKMSSELFQLVNAEDPVKFAKEHGIKIKGKSLMVNIRLAPDVEDISNLTNNYSLEVKGRRGQIISAYALVENLRPLAEENKIIYIRRPPKFILW